MVDKTTLIKVKNRDNGSVGYTIPDLGNLHRNFQSGETKEITMEELRKLSYIPGGDILLRDYLIIDNKEAVAELLGEVEPEYNYTEKEVELLLTSGTLDQLMDTLDFAPKGVIELIKEMAVNMELNDISKRKAILDKTGFDVTSAITINKVSADENESDKTENTKRRAAPIGELDDKTRRSEPIVTAGSRYKIIK